MLRTPGNGEDNGNSNQKQVSQAYLHRIKGVTLKYHVEIFFKEQFGGLTNWLWELPSRYSNFLI